jgi:IclR family pca regulon transcriptional regulator
MPWVFALLDFDSIIDGDAVVASMIIQPTEQEFTYMDNSVKSAVRTLRILELFAGVREPLALTVVARRLGIPKSSAHMLMQTLVAEGYLQDAGRGACIMPAGLVGAHAWIGGPGAALARAAAPQMDRLLALFEETVVLGAPTPLGDVRIIAHRKSPLAVAYDVSRDPVLPGWATAMGHAMLSHRPEAELRAYLARTPRVPLTARTVTDADALLVRLRACRAAGHALNIDERFEGASGVAVAILDEGGAPHGAINAVMLTPRFLRRQDEIVAALTAAAREIEAAAFGPDAQTASAGTAQTASAGTAQTASAGTAKTASAGTAKTTPAGTARTTPAGTARTTKGAPRAATGD